jgi:gluconolactonase
MTRSSLVAGPRRFAGASPGRYGQAHPDAGAWRLSAAFAHDGQRLSPGKIFHKIAPGFADGLRLDQDGNVWSSAADGVHCIAPDGTKLGRIKIPFIVSNLVFGGRNRSRLFICASHTLFAIYSNQRGAQRP